MFDISLPPTVTDAVGAAAVGNLVVLAREMRGPTYCLLAIMAGWLGAKAFVAVHHEVYGSAAAKGVYRDSR